MHMILNGKAAAPSYYKVNGKAAPSYYEEGRQEDHALRQQAECPARCRAMRRLSRRPLLGDP